jgi:RNA polymerase sigma factor (TIGR02999 family)
VATEITDILNHIADGNPHAIADLVPMVYEQMRKIAAGAMRREPTANCDPTELVHEAYLRMVGDENLAWKGRSHFYAACAVVIRRILVDQARARKSLKRGGQLERFGLDEATLEDVPFGVSRSGH